MSRVGQHRYKGIKEMKPALETPRRKSIRLKDFDYSQAGGYYVTLVTFQRENLFGEVAGGEMHVNALGRIVQECWDEIPVHFPNVTMDAFMVMPNHVHGIIFIHGDNPISVGAQHIIPVGARHVSPLQKPTHPPRGFKPGSVGAVVASFKSSVSRCAGTELNSGNIWQRNYYEHVIRDQGDYERIVAYILGNPVNWDQDEENLTI
jgi:REP element-mobilizing transposase RayT